MTHTRDQLSADAQTAAKWAEAARASGRADTAEALERLADIAAQAADRFATRGGGLVREDEADAARIRANFFRACVCLEDRHSVSDAEACPWSKEGFCKGCCWKDHRWRFSGRVYECVTAYVCGHKWPCQEPRQNGLPLRPPETRPVAAENPSGAT